MNPLLVVHLIHGTYAPHAPWIQREGVLAQELEAACPNGVIVEPCEWTGGNSWDARAEAAEKLKRHVEEMHAVYPQAKQILVAHSHGGNVALYAMNQMNHPNGVIGCACLATPFLHARFRTTELFTAANLGEPFFLVLLLTVLFVDLRFSVYDWKLNLIMFAICIIVGWICGAATVDVLQAFTQTAQTAAVVMQAEAPESVDILIIRKVGDEASMSLASGQFLAWLTTKAYSFFDKKINPGDSSFWRVGSLSWPFLWMWLVIVIAAAVNWLIPSSFQVRSQRVYTTYVLLVLILSLVTITLRTRLLNGVGRSFCLLVLAISKAVNSFAFGIVPHGSDMGGGFRRFIIGSVLSILLEIDTEATPVGSHKVIQLDRGSVESSGLSHSLYEDPRARELLVRWIKRFEVEQGAN